MCQFGVATQLCNLTVNLDWFGGAKDGNRKMGFFLDYLYMRIGQFAKWGMARKYYPGPGLGSDGFGLGWVE